MLIKQFLKGVSYSIVFLFCGSILCFSGMWETAMAATERQSGDVVKTEIRPRMPLSETIKYSKKKYKRKKYSPWSTSYFNWASQNMADTKEGVAQLSTYNFISFNYRLDKSNRLAIRPTFNISGAGNYNGRYQESSFKLGNIYLQHMKYDMFLLPGDIGVMGKHRIYIPVSDSSKRKKTIMQLRAWWLFTKPWGGGFETSFSVRPRYYMQSQRGYINQGGRVSRNKQAELWGSLDFNEKITQKFGLFQKIGWQTTWYYGVPHQGLDNEHKEVLSTWVGFDYNLGNVSFTAFLDNAVTMEFGRRRRQHKDFKFFRADQTKYSLWTYVRF